MAQTLKHEDKVIADVRRLVGECYVSFDMHREVSSYSGSERTIRNRFSLHVSGTHESTERLSINVHADEIDELMRKFKAEWSAKKPPLRLLAGGAA